MTKRSRFIYREAPQTPKEPGEDLTWEEFIDQFVAAKTKAELTEKYIYDLENSLKRSAEGLVELGVTRPYMLTTKAAKIYLDRYEATGVSKVSRNHMAQKLMTAFTWAYYEEVFSKDKLATLKKDKLKKTPKAPVVTVTEINLIVGQIYKDWLEENAPASRFRTEEARQFFGTRDVCMTLFMTETGARVGETANVLRSNIDLENRSALFLDTKNGDDRLVYYTEDFRDTVLADWLKIRDGLDTVCDNLFISELGLPLNPYRWGRQWDKYRQRAGIKRPIRRHDLRHFASTAHDRVDKDASKKLIGHHTDAAHEGYSHREEERLRAVHDEVNPNGPILTKIKADREDKAAAEAAAAQPKSQQRQKVYTKNK